MRPAVPADAPQIVRLGGLMYASMGQELTTEWRERCEYLVADRLGNDLHGWVVEGDASEPHLAACALVNVVPRLTPTWETSRYRGYIQWVSTDPRYQRRGHARALMASIQAWADVQGIQVLELHASPAGQPLYESLGYEIQGPGVPMVLRTTPRSGQ